MRWRMPEPCVDCPFNRTGPGAHLRRSLHPTRWRGILTMLKKGDSYFPCHKTSDETGDGSNLECAGAIAWQAARGLTSNFTRVMRRLDLLNKRKED